MLRMKNKRKTPFNFGGSNRLSQMRFNQFKGVDYQSNPLQMDKGRSPSAMNMIISRSGFPEKRTGYSKVHTFDGRINGIFRLKHDGKDIAIVHSGTKLYLWLTSQTSSVIYREMNNDRSVAFQREGKLYILDGKNYLVFGKFDGQYACKKVEEIAKIPTTSISRKPTGGGVTLDKVNLLTGKRINEFIGDNSSREFTLDSKDIIRVIKVEKQNAEAKWEEIPTNQYGVETLKGKVTLHSAVGEPKVKGQDNLRITFEAKNDGASKIAKCSIYDIFTYGQGEYYFFAGNPDHPNTDYRSDINDPTYFPDLNYSVIGQDNTAIMAYLKLNGKQVIIKESNQQDTSIFIRTLHIDLLQKQGENDFTEKISFRVEQGISSTGAISKYCTFNLRDDSMYLANDGLTSITTTLIGATMAQNRSYYINPSLTKKDLKNAVGIEFESKAYIAVDGNVYVADSRHKEREQNAFAESFQYEFFHWDNIPVRVWYKTDKDLYFGDESGNIFRFNHYDDNKASAKGDEFKDNGKPIVAWWDTPFLSMDELSRLKTLKNMYLVLQPNTRTSCELLFRAKGRPLRPNRPDRTVKLERQADIFDWNNIDFTRFSFITDTAPVVIPTDTKIKRFMLLQIRLQNTKPEPFGIYEMQLNFTTNGKYKG